MTNRLGSLALLGLGLLLAPLATAQGGHMSGGGGMGQGGDGVRPVIHALLSNHTKITRRVVDVPNGVETWTESEDSVTAALIRVHVRQMEGQLESAQPMRMWDPLFRAIFDRADEIDMEIEDTDNGVRVVETSASPDVVALIKQHAHRAISEFVEGGFDRAHQPTPMPEGMEAPPHGGHGPPAGRGPGSRMGTQEAPTESGEE